MSLVTSKTLLIDAMNGGYAVPAFNANCLEMIPALIRAAELEKSPLILQLGKKFLEYLTPEELAATALHYAKKAQVPVCVHLDHGASEEQAKACLEAGFTSIMFDGSAFSNEENILKTRAVVGMANQYHVPVEGEIGKVLLDEDVCHMEELTDLTEPEDAADFVTRTGISSVAVAVGNVHRMKQKTANLDFERIKTIRGMVDVPLVIHGSSGISDSDVSRAVALGINKVNVATEFNIAFIQGSVQFSNENPKEIFPMEVLLHGMEKVTEIARGRIHVVGAAGKCK